ncbi:hypothetical protein VNO77_34436 [Canavalia gladiata]|uniref:Uncharacterized protein n=1 Tax=Canavalia gladiata TaxID=3824 RepID=A0AAN9KF48_CANGL
MNRFDPPCLSRDLNLIDNHRPRVSDQEMTGPFLTLACMFGRRRDRLDGGEAEELFGFALDAQRLRLNMRFNSLIEHVKMPRCNHMHIRVVQHVCDRRGCIGFMHIDILVLCICVWRMEDQRPDPHVATWPSFCSRIDSLIEETCAWHLERALPKWIL